MAAGGGFVGPGGVLAALLVGSLLGAVAGLVNLVRFYVLIRGRDRSRRRALVTARALARYIPFGPYLAAGLWIALLHWDWIVDAYGRWNGFVQGVVG